ncbi:protein kinase domain-containing protein [Pseudoramibacter porci]|uniref:non-specific serine/threonine protein kinase n=1 Tax=Pseudoramibacter porci TaxID=2606631 RepID=A0A7X2NGU2_9FIRM|nr:protein kinase [Pseudoramibacter porci]MSS20357.1 protein kinase [Pseudoramibacter porci]
MEQNNTNQYRACRDTFFKTLYHFDVPGQSLVIDETSGRLFLRKELTYYDPSVYEFLMGCRDSRLVHVADAWQEGDRLVVLEAYVSGTPLSERLRRGDLSAPEKLTILHDVCGALGVLHNAAPPIVHRDVKPENIMVTDSGRAVLMDYDASKRVKPAQSRDTVLLGTRDSAAPEQYGFGASDVRTDVYGVGKLIAAMVGDAPLYRPIIAKATQLDPKRRYPNIAALDRALKRRDRPTANVHNWSWLRVIGTVLCVMFAFALCREMTFENSSGPIEDRITQIAFFAAQLAVIEVWFDWTGIFNHLPFRRQGQVSSGRKIVEKLIYSAVLFCLILIVAVILILCIFGG